MTHYTSYAKDVLNKFRAVPKGPETTNRFLIQGKEVGVDEVKAMVAASRTGKREVWLKCREPMKDSEINREIWFQFVKISGADHGVRDIKGKQGVGLQVNPKEKK